jgi:hypothetical protein
MQGEDLFKMDRRSLCTFQQPASILKKNCIFEILQQRILYRGGRGWYPLCSCQLAVGLAVSEMKQNIFLCTSRQIICRLMTAQAVDTLPVYIDFP